MKEVIDILNQLLADAKVFYQNLHNFHWNIQCMHFFEFHEKLGELYDAVGADTDVFAERILALGGTPISTYTEYLEMSGIPERPVESNSQVIIKAVLEDLYSTEKRLNEVRKIAVEADDEGTNALMGEKLMCIQKGIWMWSASLHEKPDLEKSESESSGTEEEDDSEKKAEGGSLKDPEGMVFKIS